MFFIIYYKNYVPLIAILQDFKQICYIYQYHISKQDLKNTEPSCDKLKLLSLKPKQ